MTAEQAIRAIRGGDDGKQFVYLVQRHHAHPDALFRRVEALVSDGRLHDPESRAFLREIQKALEQA